MVYFGDMPKTVLPSNTIIPPPPKKKKYARGISYESPQETGRYRGNLKGSLKGRHFENSQLKKL